MQVDTSMNDIENSKPPLLLSQQAQEQQPYFTQQQQAQQSQQTHLRSRLPQPKVYFNNRR